MAVLTRVPAMAAKKKTSSPRTERRALERDVKKQLEQKDRLAELSPGGAPERPITVETAALVEPLARASRCPRCDGAVRLEEHSARIVSGRSLRAVSVSCSACGSTRELFYVIEPRVLH